MSKLLDPRRRQPRAPTVTDIDRDVDRCVAAGCIVAAALGMLSPRFPQVAVVGLLLLAVVMFGICFFMREREEPQA